MNLFIIMRERNKKCDLDVWGCREELKRFGVWLYIIRIHGMKNPF